MYDGIHNWGRWRNIAGREVEQCVECGRTRLPRLTGDAAFKAVFAMPLSAMFPGGESLAAVCMRGVGHGSR